MIRTAARAMIIRDRKLLTVAYRSATELFYVLPGGGQQPGESLHETVQRECWEELGTSVEIGRLLYVREFIPKNHDFPAADLKHHQGIDFIFSCRIPDAYTPQLGEHPDPDQAGVAWLPIPHLATFNFYPAALQSSLISSGLMDSGLINLGSDPYLGDIN